MPEFALILTAAPGCGALEPRHAEAILAALPASSGPEAAWLSPGEAWQVVFRASGVAELTAVRSAASAGLIGLPVDLNIILAAEPRRKRLLVADMESTIVGQEFIDELAEAAGIGAEIAAVTARAMKGEIEFEGALRERVARFGGLDAGLLDRIYARATLNPGAETLVRTMRRHGARCALVSGGFSFFTDRIAERVGFDTHQANTLLIENGRIAGAVAEPILGREAKRAALERLAAEQGIDTHETLAVGDGANDLAMIRAAGLGVAYHAKPIVAAEAAASIMHGDLTALLYLQGYARSEFAN